MAATLQPTKDQTDYEPATASKDELAADKPLTP